jgi:hypothetical protein
MDVVELLSRTIDQLSRKQLTDQRSRSKIKQLIISGAMQLVDLQRMLLSQRRQQQQDLRLMVLS